jgi:hypothetical protein
VHESPLHRLFVFYAVEVHRPASLMKCTEMPQESPPLTGLSVDALTIVSGSRLGAA